MTLNLQPSTPLLPLVDTHCHLLLGLDDGPESWDDAVTMCRMAWDDGVRAIAATSHQNESWRDATPARIRQATVWLAARLEEAGIPLAVYPCAEVMVGPELEDAWERDELMTVADRGQYLLIELPHGLFLDLRDLAARLINLGVRPILAHPERHPEILHGNGVVDELILCGCLIQVSAESVTQPSHPRFAEALCNWVRRGVVHLIGSDGQCPTRRPPGISAAHEQIARWAGPAVADRICGFNGMAVLEGLPLTVPRPGCAKKHWFPRRLFESLTAPG